MQFSIASGIFEKSPSLHVGVIVCKGIKNLPSPSGITAKLRGAEKTLRSSIADPDALKLHPNIVALQELHRAFGNNPNKFPPSSQALAKRVLKGGELPTISTLVDLYNIISLKYLLPAGGEDLDTCSGNMELTLAKGGEPFTPLGETENASPEPGEFVYRDDAGIICRKMNWREGVRTCLTEKTVNAILVIEAVPPTDRTVLQAALDELRDAVQAYAGGTLTLHILHREHSTVTL